MNTKGQALIESMIILSIVTVSSIFLIRAGLQMQNALVLDELLEDALVCKLQKKTTCVQALKSKLLALNFKTVVVQDRTQGSSARLAIEALSNFASITKLESELTLELAVD